MSGILHSDDCVRLRNSPSLCSHPSSKIYLESILAPEETKLTLTATLCVHSFGQASVDALTLEEQDDPETQEHLTSRNMMLEQALDDFVQRTHSAITQAGKHPVVWQEMVLNHNVTLVNETAAL